MQVRLARAEDHDSVIMLMQQLSPDDPKLSESVSRSVYSRILESDGLSIMVAEKDNTIVGTCYLNVIPNLTRGASPYAIIENVVTHCDHRRTGIGSALMSNALEYAQQQGCYKVMLLTGGGQEALSFYESCGMQSGTKTAFVVRYDNR